MCFVIAGFEYASPNNRHGSNTKSKFIIDIRLNDISAMQPCSVLIFRTY
jgi:hypothetical protein